MSIAPKWGMNRVRARTAANVFARHYEASEPGRRTQGWARQFGDADRSSRASLTELRMHARDLIRNNAWARRAQRVIANNTVGWGIMPKPVGGDAVAAKLSALWTAWAGTTECESEGRHTFYSMQNIAMKTIAESGEILFRRRSRRPSDGLSVPLQIQILEPDYLDQGKEFETSQAGGPIIQGVEFDLIGRRAAYWIFPRHPGSGRNVLPSERIPATEIVHAFYSERPGQTRGVSWYAPAIVTLKDFDEFEDASLMRQKIAGCFAAFVTDMDGATGTTGGPDTENFDPLVEAFEPGMIQYLPVGKDIKFGNPPMTTDDGFSDRQLRRVAAGLGVTFEDLTGDYSKVNFSSARMARLAHWANVRDWQWNMLVPSLCDGIWQWFVTAAQSEGLIPLAVTPSATWTPPPMPMIEPDKEGLAYQRLVRGGFMTLSGALREQGEDPDTHLAEFAADNAKLDALGIVLDSDPRKVSQVGQVQIEPKDPATTPKESAADRALVAAVEKLTGVE